MEVIPSHAERRVVSGADVGAPNMRDMRAARQTEEVDALEARVNKAKADCQTKGTKTTLREFVDKINSASTAVINMPLGRLMGLLLNDNMLYSSYYQMIEGEARLPEQNEYDSSREAVDSMILSSYPGQTQRI
jgi:hypothetical protein